MTSWNTDQMPDQTGRVVVITGASSGIGKAAARALIEKGAYVLMACRNVDKAELARAEFAGLPGGSEVRQVDISDLQSVRNFADGIADWRVDVLINNAGIMATPFKLTEQGFESQWATNVLGHFLLTQMIVPKLTDRVVWLSSMAHRGATLDLDAPTPTKRSYHAWITYQRSKLADLMLAYEQERRFIQEGSTLRSMAAHPGLTKTNLQGKSGRFWQDIPARVMTYSPMFVMNAREGALPTLYAATVPDLAGGTYVGPSGFMEVTGAPLPVSSSSTSHDRDLAARLWDTCLEQVGEYLPDQE